MNVLTLTPLAGALRFAREHLGRTDNLGRTGDGRDVYAVIAELASGVRGAHPGSACAQGCSECCAMHKALFRVFRSEWETIHDHVLEHWEPERLTAFVRRFWREAGPHLPLLEALQARMDRGERPRPAHEELPIDCPFLEERRCAVYPARAAICRGFGYFHLRRGRDDAGAPGGQEGEAQAGARLEIYACNRQRAVLRAEPPDGVRPALPVFNTVYARIETICEGEPKRLMPLWIARTFPDPQGV